jgi:hypothetical protein
MILNTISYTLYVSIHTPTNSRAVVRKKMLKSLKTKSCRQIPWLPPAPQVTILMLTAFVWWSSRSYIPILFCTFGQTLSPCKWEVCPPPLLISYSAAANNLQRSKFYDPAHYCNAVSREMTACSRARNAQESFHYGSQTKNMITHQTNTGLFDSICLSSRVIMPSLRIRVHQ